MRQKIGHVIERFCAKDIIPTVYFTQKKGDAKEMAKNVSAEFETVVCAGGDGTLNEVISGLLKNPVPHTLGYIPTGTTNDLANSLGIPKDVLAATDNVINGQRVKIDTGLFGEKTFTYIASFGAFTEASYSTPQEVKNAIGHIAYLFEGIKSLSSLRSYKVKFSFEEEKEIEEQVIFAAISNTTSMGGVLKLDDSLVALNDGLLEVLIIKEPESLNDFQKIVSELLTGKFSGELISLYHTKKVTVSTKESIDWTLDGEHEKGAEEIVIKNLKQSVNFIVPMTEEDKECLPEI